MDPDFVQRAPVVDSSPSVDAGGLVQVLEEPIHGIIYASYKARWTFKDVSRFALK